MLSDYQVLLYVTQRYRKQTLVYMYTTQRVTRNYLDILLKCYDMTMTNFFDGIMPRRCRQKKGGMVGEFAFFRT